jgi:hypothetical protein
MGKKMKILALIMLLIIIPILKGLKPPTSWDPFEIFIFFIEIAKFWQTNIESLLETTVGIF